MLHKGTRSLQYVAVPFVPDMLDMLLLWLGV
jgi:hypothetical protein